MITICDAITRALKRQKKKNGTPTKSATKQKKRKNYTLLSWLDMKQRRETTKSKMALYFWGETKAGRKAFVRTVSPPRYCLLLHFAVHTQRSQTGTQEHTKTEKKHTYGTL